MDIPVYNIPLVNRVPVYNGIRYKGLAKVCQEKLLELSGLIPVVLRERQWVAFSKFFLNRH